MIKEHRSINGFIYLKIVRSFLLLYYNSLRDSFSSFKGTTNSLSYEVYILIIYMLLLFCFNKRIYSIYRFYIFIICKNSIFSICFYFLILILFLLYLYYSIQKLMLLILVHRVIQIYLGIHWYHNSLNRSMGGTFAKKRGPP